MQHIFERGGKQYACTIPENVNTAELIQMEAAEVERADAAQAALDAEQAALDAKQTDTHSDSSTAQ